MAVASFIPRSLPVELYAGDGVELTLTVTALDGSEVELAGEVVAEVKAKRGDDDARAVFDVSVDGNVATLRMTGATTGELGQFRGVWDCQWTADGQQPRTLVQGPVSCRLDVTRIEEP